jgi:hypothetical protein
MKMTEEILDEKLLNERLMSMSFSDLKAFKDFSNQCYDNIITEAESKEDAISLTSEKANHLLILNQVIEKRTMGVFFPPEY